MPTYLITAPDGRKFKVTGEGSREDALAQIQSRYKPDLKTANPAEYDAASPEYQRKYGATTVGGENFSAGVGKAFVDTGRGLRQLAVEAGDAIGLLPEGSAEQARQRASENAAMDAPLMRSKAGIAGNITGNVALFAAPGAAIARPASALGRIGSGAAQGAALANTQPVTAEQSRLGNTAWGAAGGAAGEVIAAGIGKAISPSAKISPEIAALAQKADELGIPLRAEQVSQSRPLAGVSAALDTIPLSGRDASREAQRRGFNRAIARTFGQESDNLATAVKQGENILGAKYDAILKSHAVRADDALLSGLDDVLQTARAELNDAQFGVIQRQVDGVLDKIGPNGEIDGRAAYNIKKMLDRIGRGQDSSLAYHARDLRDTVIEGLDRSLPEDVAKTFAQTRAQYGNLISVRKLLKPGADGRVTPAMLGNNRNLRGELKDVADVGATFLKEPFGNSGTANRMIGAGLLGGGTLGAFVEPTAALALGATIGGARATNSLMQSPIVMNYLLHGIPGLAPALPFTNRLLPALGTAGAIASQ